MSSAASPEGFVSHADEIAAHARFVRALAFDLVHDAEGADELAARAMAEALARWPDSGASLRTTILPSQSLRAWFRRVVWRLFRRELRDVERRGRRELVAARDEAQPATVDLVAQMELERKIGEAFAALEEPFKSALFRRYFHDETPTQIAERAGEPLATVKSRLQRGLVQLRARLDAAHAGRRDEWLAALVPWLSLGGPVVATKGKLVALAAAVVIAAGAGVAIFESSNHPAPPDDARSTAAPAVAQGIAHDETKPAAQPPAAPVAVPAAERTAEPTLAELVRMLSSSRRMDQLRAIELLLALDRPEAIQALIHAFMTTTDPVLRVLLEDAMVNSTLDLSPSLVDAYRGCTDPDVLAQLTRMLTSLAAKQPGLDDQLVKLFVEALAEPQLRTELALALDAALVKLGMRALPALTAYLTDPAADVRGAGTAAAVLAKLDASLAANVREAARAGIAAMQKVLEAPESTDEQKNTARQRTGSLAWAVGERPAAEHDLLAQDLLDHLLTTPDSPQAGTFAWGLSNLKGITDDARLATIRAILTSAPKQSKSDLRQSYMWAVGQLISVGYGARPLDAQFTVLVDAVNDAIAHNRSDAGVAGQMQWLLDQIRAFEAQKRQ